MKIDKTKVITRGEWKIEDSTIMAVDRSGGIAVAKVLNVGPSTQINARLIAAAPEMLEIFEELEIHLNHQYDALYPDTQEFLNRIEAVIRRIES